MIRISYIIFLLVFVSCNKEQAERLVLEDLMAERKQAYLDKKEKECKEKAFEEARQYVDSLVNKWVQDDLIDTINFPTRPVRPERPEDILEKH